MLRLLDKILGLLPSQGNELVLRDAARKDARFVINLIQREVAAGHFAGWQSRVHKTLFAGAVRHMLISEQQWPRLIDPNPHNDEILYARLWIGVAGRKRIGFVAICEVMPGSFQHAVELWMVAVAPEHRGRGAGKAMVDHVLNTLVEQGPKRKIIARCLPASQTMFDMLKRRGFRLVAHAPDGGGGWSASRRNNLPVSDLGSCPDTSRRD